MAWLEKRADRYRINYRHDGRKQQVALQDADETEARACLARFNENFRLFLHGRLDIPDGADLGVFLLSDGKLNRRPVVRKPLSLREFFDHYRKHLPATAKEKNTRSTEEIHLAHLERLLGRDTAITAITTEGLQSYVDARSNEKSRFRQLISSTTIKKELGTFASVWNKWGVPQGLVAGPAPTRGLIYGKAAGKPPFQTREQIERQIARGGLTAARIKALWGCLFLTLEEIERVLAHVRTRVRGRGFLYPMFVFAAHTGARRSEMLRSRIDDFDFEAGLVTIREKKKDRSKDLTFRAVPMTPLLRETMTAWFAAHPGGPLTICSKPDVAVTVQSAAKGFRRVVQKSGWAILPGWHVFRHSFASNCARKGLDQRGDRRVHGAHDRGHAAAIPASVSRP